MMSKREDKRRGLQTTYGVEFIVKDKDGNVINRHVQEAKSFLPNYMKWLLSILGVKSMPIIDLNNNVVNILASQHTGVSGYAVHHILANPTQDQTGIRVGSSNQPVSPLDYNLIQFIPHGTITNRLQYGQCTTDDNILLQGNESSFIASRTFTNSSGSGVTVGEAGVVMYSSIGGTNQYEAFFLIARDAISSPLIIPDAATLTVRYKFRILT